MDDLTGQCARLSLHTKECQTIPLNSVIENKGRVLVVKLFTKRRVNVESLARTLKSIRMNKAIALAIGNTIGSVEQVDTSPSGECQGRCVRPLCRGWYVDLGGSDPHQISFQYECLLVFCYWCSLLNHDEKDYRLVADSGESL
ncbi:hypothetical protein CFP56_008132 [Quercus suber]|uniref:Zinc knuckle CX2CX4HX4C domain-containing protein n=1 Tax=Quercus suber TaxID=58331 RepID=A0AAW0L684_QUESU